MGESLRAQQPANLVHIEADKRPRLKVEGNDWHLWLSFDPSHIHHGMCAPALTHLNANDPHTW